ncbi:substrate-binding domain-containing protein [bacterium]|jgi:ribose transport system substrate-binding protein|nr:substrate-binding domain-containing protein [bacterium]
MKIANKCFLPVALCALLLSGCSGGESTPSSQESTTETATSNGTIAISVLTTSNPYFNVIIDSFTEEAKKHGYDVLATSGEFDVAKQQNQVKDFIVKQVTAIVLCPCDSKSIGPAIQEANAAGIPVFTADIACLAPDAEIVSHIATDNLGGGREAGHAMIEALGEAGGKVVILDYKSAESCLLRVQGFKEIVGAHNTAMPDSKIDIVMELPGEGKKDRGYKAAEDAVQAHADLAGIFAINDPSALGARAALEKAGKADQVKIIGFDGQPEGKQAIKEGKIYADPIQFPDEIGRTTMQTILSYLKGEEVKSEILIPTKLYRQSDGIADPELK